ncbi:MAG TPA: protein-L-isoaspartate O-methyltransferase [Rhodospirillales bacterium]|nr:protein-L-isoaspartate O-methyltransferase [Rhodospirillales bacterium]
MDFAAARYKMVQNQIRTNRVTDPLILEAMSELERERFLPEALRGIAYIDEDIPLDGGRFLIEPLAAALLLQSADIDADDVVLDIGCGPGYLSAIIARIASAVVALESDAALAAQAAATLAELGSNTATVVVGPLREGWRQQAPYDVIVLGGAVAEVPAGILGQLADGGRLLAVVAGDRGRGRGTLFLRRGESVSRRPLFDSSIPMLPEFTPQPTFRF